MTPSNLWAREHLTNQEGPGHGGTAPREGHSAAWFLSPSSVSYIVNKRPRTGPQGFKVWVIGFFSPGVRIYWPEGKIPDKTRCFHGVSFNFAYITPSYQMNKSCGRIYSPFGKCSVTQWPAPWKRTKGTILWAWLKAFIFFTTEGDGERNRYFLKKKKKMWAWKELWNFTKVLVLKYYVGDNSKSTSLPSPSLSVEATLCWGSEPGPLLQIRLSSLILAWRLYCSFWEKCLRRGGRRPGMLLQEWPLITCVGWHGSFSGPPLLISERKDVDHEFSSRTFSNIWVIWSWLGVGVVLVASSE